MKTWLITGASSGIGAALARAVLAAGHNAVVTARDATRVESLADGHPGRVLPIALDLTQPEGITAALNAAQARFGGIDVLVNNAGLAYFGAVEEGEDAAIRTLFEANVFGLAAMLRAALPAMRARGSGTIVNFSSASGVIAYPGLGYYSASKFAVEGLTEALWREVEPLGLKVILVEPGAFRTGINARSPRAPVKNGCAPAAHQMLDFLEASGDAICPGDPERAAAVLVRVVDTGKAPHRLIMGSDCFDGVMEALDDRKQEYKTWETVSRSTDS
jgi:NAD(P)-dependent dehydrogenase (short-subunit alcohol dehydrogenase family)